MYVFGLQQKFRHSVGVRGAQKRSQLFCHESYKWHSVCSESETPWTNNKRSKVHCEIFRKFANSSSRDALLLLIRLNWYINQPIRELAEKNRHWTLSCCYSSHDRTRQHPEIFDICFIEWLHHDSTTLWLVGQREIVRKNHVINSHSTYRVWFRFNFMITSSLRVRIETVRALKTNVWHTLRRSEVLFFFISRQALYENSVTIEESRSAQQVGLLAHVYFIHISFAREKFAELNVRSFRFDFTCTFLSQNQNEFNEHRKKRDWKWKNENDEKKILRLKQIYW